MRLAPAITAAAVLIFAVTVAADEPTIAPTDFRSPSFDTGSSESPRAFRDRSSPHLPNHAVSLDTSTRPRSAMVRMPRSWSNAGPRPTGALRVLRFSWIYERVRATEYFYVYPPAWQTGGLYFGTAALLLAMLTRRLARGTEDRT